MKNGGQSSTRVKSENEPSLLELDDIMTLLATGKGDVPTVNERTPAAILKRLFQTYQEAEKLTKDETIVEKYTGKEPTVPIDAHGTAPLYTRNTSIEVNVWGKGVSYPNEISIPKQIRCKVSEVDSIKKVFRLKFNGYN
jgi:hypothetical protein